MSNPEEIKTKLRKLEEIPTLPGFFARMMETIDSDKTSVGDLAHIIGEDPALTAKVFKLANSAFYGRFKKVATMEQAVSTIGFNEIKTIALSIGVFGAFSDRISKAMLEAFWVHALTSATTVRAIGDRDQETSVEKVYFGALLHDIGKLVLTMIVGDEYVSAMSNCEGANDLTTLRVEKDTFGVHHAQVGKWLSDRWHFPNELVEVIAFHHQPHRPTLLRPRSVATVFVSDFISHNLHKEEIVIPDDDTRLSGSLSALGIDEADIETIRSRVLRQEEKINETFALVA
ncbi:MAG: HDOD domain-containing protein [Pseudomonadota bacterium]